MPGGSSGYGGGRGGKDGRIYSWLDARGGSKRNPPGIPLPEFRGGDGIRPPGRRARGDRGAPPGPIRRLGLLRGTVPDPRDPGLARKRLHHGLSLIHISEPTRLGMISYAVFCLKKKKFNNN